MTRVCLFALGMILAGRLTAAGGSAAIWRPAPQVDWQWQLTGAVDRSVAASVYDIDLFDNDATVVAALHGQGRKVICYLSAGTYEDWRPDASRFPDSVKGRPLDDFPDERWLDIRRLDVLKPILEARLDLCKQKGFDAVEPDNVDGYINRTGFPLSARDQIAFNTWLATAAHARGLSIGLKNDLDQVKELEPLFDWALSEQCFEYRECGLLKPFLDAGKAVLEVEYNLEPSRFCAEANAMNLNAMRKNFDLDAARTPCRTVGQAPAIAAVANAASYQTSSVAPGLLAAVFGSRLGRVLFDGLEAPAIYNNGEQAVVAVPYAVAGRSRVNVATESGGLRSAVFPIAVTAAAPALFTAAATGAGQIAMLNQNGALNGPSAPAAPGEIVICYATGEGQTSPGGVDGRVNTATLPKPVLPVAVEVGGAVAEVLYAGAAPGMMSGVMQVNFRVPAAAATGAAVRVVLKVGAFASQNQATMAVAAK